jgi:hypothetical protein
MPPSWVAWWLFFARCEDSLAALALLSWAGERSRTLWCALQTKEVDVSDPQLDLTVRAVVARQVRLPPDNLSGGLDLLHDLGLDEDGGPELLSAMGEALDAIFPDDFLEGVHTYADLTAAVRVSLGP